MTLPALSKLFLPFVSDRRGLFASVFLVTLAIRCLFVFQWTQTPYATMPLLDAKVYHEWAQAIAAGDFLRGKAFYQSPLYPYFLGLIYALFGEHFALVGVINALFEATTATLLAALTLALFESRAGALIAAGLFAFYRSAIFYTAPVMKEPLGLLLETAFLYVLYRAFQRPKVRSFFISGLLLGLAALVRGNFLCLAPIVLLYGFFLFRKSFSVKACFFVLGLMLAVAPATLHNYLVSGDFVLTNYTDGFNLYIGNSPYANGTNAYPPEVSTDPVQEELNTIWVATDELGRALSPSEVSSYWRSRALAFMVENPLRTIELVFNKALAFWNGTEQFDNYDTAFIEQNFDTLLSWPLVPYWLVTALGMAGAVLLWPTHKRKVFFLLLFLAAYMGSLLLFYVTDRYRLPAIVFLIPMAGAGLTAFYSKIRNRLWSGLALAGLAGGFFLFLGVRPPLYPVDLTAFNWGTLCMVYSDLEQDQKAIEAFTKATAVSPLKAGAGAYVRVSYAYEHLGQDAQAKQALDRAIQLFPQSGIVLYNYARFLAARSQLDQALVFFEKASKLSPFYLLNYYALAKGYAIKGNKESALAFAEQGLRIDPSDPLLNQAKAEIIGESR